MGINQLPAEGGSYILLLHCDRASTIRVGALGEQQLLSGYYLYTGSAFGSGGLRARLGRHLAGSPNKRWHIDYLRSVSAAKGGWYATKTQNLEHEFAGALKELSSVNPVIPGFGSSDCRCATHLFYTETPPPLAELLPGIQLRQVSSTR